MQNTPFFHAMHNQRPAFRLIIIPLLIYAIWTLDTYLLEGSLSVYAQFQPWHLLLYTLVVTILTGIIVPAICLQSAFMSGAVNMFQIGFRTPRRTLLTTVITGLAGCLFVLLIAPSGWNSIALIGVTALMLPVAASAVMVCWVLVGTHLQAYMRDHGALVSIIAGVIVTGILFGLSFLAHSPPLTRTELPLFILVGTGCAVFFFSVRDIYATALFLAFALAPVMVARVDPLYFTWPPALPAGCAMLSVIALVLCQYYLSLKFITVRIPAGFSDEKMD